MARQFDLYSLVDKHSQYKFCSAVFHRNGYKYATNRFILCKIKAQYDEIFEGRLVNKDGTMLPEDTPCPKYDLCIPEITEDFVSVEVNFAKVKSWQNEAKLHKKEWGKKAPIYVYMSSIDVAFEYSTFIKCIKAMCSLGISSIWAHAEKRMAPVVAKSDIASIVVMPSVAQKKYDNTDDIKWFVL